MGVLGEVRDGFVTGGAARRELLVSNGDVTLAGSLWLPESRQIATVLMYPGSGPADRDNGGYFVPIRAHLLERGCAVCSFDKRGVGSSTGRWQDAGIVEQAQDVRATLHTLVTQTAVQTPVGLFGHSQGGWVVLEAAWQQASVAFVVTNSGPGVSPADQERYSVLCRLTRAGLSAPEIDEGLRHFDLTLTLLRERVPFEQARRRLEASPTASRDTTVATGFLPADANEWRFASAIIDYDPRPAMRCLRVPLLAVFGADDVVVPVEQSVRRFRASVPANLLTVRVFGGADHRIHAGDGTGPADGHLETLSTFIERQARQRRQAQ